MNRSDSMIDATRRADELVKAWWATQSDQPHDHLQDDLVPMIAAALQQVARETRAACGCERCVFPVSGTANGP